MATPREYLVPVCARAEFETAAELLADALTITVLTAAVSAAIFIARRFGYYMGESAVEDTGEGACDKA